MKNLAPPPRTIPCLLIVLLISLSFQRLNAQQWTAFNAMDVTEPVCTITSSTNDSVTFTVIIPGMYSETVDSLQRIWIPGHNKMDSVGFPELPVVSYLVAIPDCDSVALSCSPTDSLLINNWNIYPAPEMVEDTTAQGFVYLAEKFTYDTTCYTTDALFPSSNTELVDKGAFRAQHCIRVVIYPVQFNPVGNQLKVFSDLKIKLNFTNASGSVNENVGIFNEIAGNTMINYLSNGKNASISCGEGLQNKGTWFYVDSLPNQKIDTACDYLIVTPEKFYTDSVGFSAINKLAAHRAEFNGFDVAIITTSTIEKEVLPLTLKLNVKILKLIENTYNSSNSIHSYDDKLAYVNLFGDVILEPNLDGIPTYSDGYDDFFTQITYDTIINGNDTTLVYDPYPDLMIGRCSVDDTTQIKNVVHKILHFKPDTLAWKENMLTVVGTNTYEDAISDGLLNLNETVGDQYNNKLSIPSDFKKTFPAWDTIPYNLDSIQKAYQEGQMFFNYLGHGATIGWLSPLQYYDSIPGSPDYNLPFIVSCACHTGAFQSADEEDCLGEELLCSDSAKGAICFIGASIFSTWESMQLALDYQHSLLNNFSAVIGEAFMEMKMSKYIELDQWIEHFNLLGDPALNILYENTDSIMPELIIKDYEVNFEPQIANTGDTLQISPVIRNMTIVNIPDTFYISCNAINKLSNDTLWIGNTLINGLDGYARDTVSFNWILGKNDYGVYDFLFMLDTSNSVAEMNDNNNMTVVQKPVYLYDAGFGFTGSASINSAPISFNISADYAGKEIIFGRNVISADGDTISTNPGKSSGLTCIANLTNNQNYQIIQRIHDEQKIIISTGTPNWSYQCSAGSSFIGNHIVFDIDNSGHEEVLVFAQTDDLVAGTPTLICLNYNGTLRWDFDLMDNSCIEVITCHIDEIPTILIPSDSGVIYYAKESNNTLVITDSIPIYLCNSMSGEWFVADIDQDGNLDLVLNCEVAQNGFNKDAIVLIDLISQSVTQKTFDVGDEIALLGISDINNDGYIEIITHINNSGICILGHDLDSLNFITDTSKFGKDFVSGDFNNDGENDIVCEVEINDQDYIRIYEASGNELFTVPTISSVNSFWLSDIDENDKIDLLYSSNRDLYIIDLPNNGESIGWPGQRGNVRNTGTLLQPAYYKANDTVYWTDNISIPDTFEIPSRTTVIVKPGTHIFAKEDAEFIVYGKLIAKGTEHHPIKFTANVMGAEKDHWGGITTKTRGIAELQYCHIENATVGLFLYASSPADVENNTFKNNKVGLCAYANSPNLIENYFTQNGIALACHASSSPKLVGGNPFNVIKYYNGIINNDTAISIYNSLPMIKDGYNDIYNDTLGVYMVFVDDYPINLNVRNNFYGSSDTSEVFTHFSPSANFTIDPLLDSAQTNFKSITTNSAEELLALAYERFYEKQYQTAAQLFEQLIQIYPATNEALYAITGEFEATKIGELGWAYFVENMNYLLQDTVIDTSLEKYAFEYKNLALRVDGKYTDAIENYESIINEPVSYYDSLYAIINLSNTLLESSGYKSMAVMEKIEETLLTSELSHIIRTKELLFSTAVEKQTITPEGGCVTINNIFPNPARRSFTVEYHSCEEGISLIDLYSASGKKVLGKQLYAQPGKNTFRFNKSATGYKTLKPGVYIIKVTNNNQSDSQRLIVK
ncbi:MAG: hypothetical protein B6I19_02615 [Bacteroidetes bacterium 4572_114]|nr:MAG: hypothetical protein B6I19_02615 [Bacteroidetes bacterium 4572_114]